MSGPAIRVERLSKTFQLHQERRNSLKERVVRGRSRRGGVFRALENVSIEIPRGTTFGLVGHNGSGKSTLLKILAGVYRPTNGAVLVDGRVSALLELGAGFHPELTGRENVYLNGAILGMSRKQIDESIQDIIDFAGIGDFVDAPVKVYSSGMYVRLGFAIAVHLDPEILIVDEIIAVGDEEFQRKCFDYLFELRRRGTTIVLVTHSMGLAAELCDQAAWLDHGHVRAIGPVREVVDSYLADVNEREARQRISDAPEAGLLTDAAALRRQGSGEVRVRDITFLDGAGDPAPFLTPAEPCTVRIHFEAREALHDIEFGLAFVHESGAILAGPNSGEAGKSYDLERGSGYVDFFLGQFPLEPGPFQVTAAAVSQGHIYDYADRAFGLVVRSRSASGAHGMTRIFGEWGDIVRDRTDVLGAERG